MLYYWQKAATRTLALLLLSLLALPSGYAANGQDSKKEVLLAELAEDENVEDVERSAPRRTNGDTVKPGQQKTPQPEPGKDTPSPSRVAPNVDLKEVSPPEIKPVEVQARSPEDGITEPEAAPEPETATSKQADPEKIPEDPDQTTETVDAGQPEEASSLNLLGTEVRPGTSTRLSWSPGIQIAGLTQPTPVLVVNGVNPGPNLCLTGAIHGDELNGIEIIRRTMYDLNPEKLAGRVIGIPIVNLPGFQQGTRYLPDRRDLNRHFPGSTDGSLADRIAHSLFEKIIRNCDMLVDIHTGSLKRTNLPQLRADMNDPAVAEMTRGFDRMAVVHSSGSDGMLRYAANEIGVPAVTMEAGESHRIQEHQIDAGVNSLNSLLEKQGMVSRFFSWGDPEPVYYDSEWIRAPNGGILFSDVELGATVSEGEILGYVADPITNAQHPIRATLDGRIIGMAVDQVVMAGFAAYHVGTEAEVPGE